MSVTSSKRDNNIVRDKLAERMEELESARALNRSLSAYLEHIRMFKKQLSETNKNMEELTKVNKQWDDLLSMTKQRH